MAYPIARWTLFPVLRSFFRCIEGLEHLPRQPYIIAANHVGSIDYAFIASALYGSMQGYIHFIAQPEAWRNFFIKHFLHCIIIDPMDKSRCLDEAEVYLGRGDVCAIYPEGKASRNNPELLQGKYGVARLALRTGLPVVPIGFIGPWGHRTFFRTMKGFKEFYKKTELRVGRPLQWPVLAQKEMTTEKLDEAVDAIMTEIGHLCHKTYPY